ncbi:MAG: hypothetical protein AB7Y74_15875 [Syntrophorhabdus sp.]
MQNRIVKTLVTSWVVIVFLTIFGCGTNIEHIQTTETNAPQSMVYNAPSDHVWSAAVAALSADATFKVLDKASGIMVTEFKTIDSKELSLASTYFLGKTYKSNYTVNFLSKAADKTEVKVNVSLQAVQMALLAREEDQPQVKSYLRQKLFDQIAANLPK